MTVSSHPSDRLRRTWNDGRVALGAFIMTRLDPVSVEALARRGYDYLCIDLQHGTMDVGEAAAMIQVMAGAEVTPLVRVPANDPAVIGRVLDAGALGVVVPMVETAQDAAKAVAACRYAPEGTRSFGPLRASTAYGGRYAGEANARVLCIPMIETAEAVRSVDEIAAVPGVDALYVGPADLAISYGERPGPVLRGTAGSAVPQIVAAALRNGPVAGMHATADQAGACLDAGFRMITVASDYAVIADGFKSALDEARSATGTER